jgi:DNA repair ATPase RecN
MTPDKATPREWWIVESPSLGEVITELEKEALELYHEEKDFHKDKAKLIHVISYEAFAQAQQREKLSREMINAYIERCQELMKENADLKDQLQHCSDAYQDLGKLRCEELDKLDQLQADFNHMKQIYDEIQVVRGLK